MEQKLTALPRVVLLSSGGLLGDLVLRRLQESGKFRIAGVVRSRRVMLRGAGFLRGAAAYFLRCGVVYTVYIWTITTFAEFVGLFSGTGSITARAKRAGIPILHSRDINDEKGREFLRRLEPDLIVSAHFDQKIYPPLCDRPERPVVNIHPSLLPHYRGLEPVLQAMKAGDNKFGVTVHRLAESIDAGGVLALSQTEPDPKHSVLRTTYELLKQGADLLLRDVDRALRPGEATSQQAGGSYHSWPGGRDIVQLYRRGKHLAKLSDVALFWRRD
jgi:methionyl-tRNA formyltransferase